MIPLSKLHEHLSVPIWYLSIFVFFMGAIFLIKKILIADDKEKVLSKTVLFLAILMTMRFLLSVVQRVQSDCLVLFLLALFIFFLFYKKDVLASLALATATMVKLTPLIFLPYLLLKRRLKAAAAYSGFILAYLLAPALYLGQNENLEYLKGWFFSLTKKVPPEYFIWYKNQSLLSMLMRFLTADSPDNILSLNPLLVSIIFIALAAGLFALIFILRPKETNAPAGFSYLTDISLVLICMILFSPLAWKHSFVHLIIPHLVLLYYLRYINPGDKATRLLVIISFFLNTVLNPELTKPFAQTIQLYSNVTFGTLILYLAMLRIRYKLCTH